jgi:hypothetical protein
LVFWLQGQTVTPNPDYWALVHSADVQVDSAQGRLAGVGLARPATPLRFATRPTPSTVSAQFRLSVTAHQLAAIETLRNCGDLTFKLVVSGEGGPRSDPDRIERIHEDFWLREERSAWIDKLVAAKALDVTLLEIPMPFVDPRGPSNAHGNAAASAASLRRGALSRKHHQLPHSARRLGCASRARGGMGQQGARTLWHRPTRHDQGAAPTRHRGGPRSFQPLGRPSK